MIVTKDNKVSMNFGSGDIGFNSGVMNVDNDSQIGIIVFYNQQPREIGSLGDIPAGVTVDLDDFPVMMSFTKSKSIDVLIDALLEIKQNLIG